MLRDALVRISPSGLHAIAEDALVDRVYWTLRDAADEATRRGARLILSFA